MAYTYEALKDEYTRLWETMEIRPNWSSPCKAIAQRIIDAKDRYLVVANATGVPWFVVGIFHHMECGGSWFGCLHNGDRWDRKTINVPRGLGPWKSWEEAAIHAMRYDKVDQIKDWGPERVAFANEKYNGFGPRMKGYPTAYLWSGTNQYTKGKYVSDGVWSPTAVSGQPGAMPILKSLMILDPKISFDDERAVAAEEFPKAEKPPASHQEAHALLKEEKPIYGLWNEIVKKLGLPLTIGGASATGASASGAFEAWVPAISFFKDNGWKVALAVVIITACIEGYQYTQRQKVMA